MKPNVTGSFWLNDIEFRIVEAECAAFKDRDGCRRWNFSIKTAENPDLPEGHELWLEMPRLYCEHAVLAIDNLADMIGKEVCIPSAFDTVSGHPIFGFYLWEHGDVTNTRLKFMERQNTNYRLAWSAKGHNMGQVFGIRVEGWIADKTL